MNKKIPMAGKVFGKLTAVWEVIEDGKPSRWFCKCECGGFSISDAYGLRQGKSTSCGCNRASFGYSNKTHGMSTSAEYRTWSLMKRRCTNLNDKSYEHYGAVGIKVCKRWLVSFENFYTDMGKKPSSKHSIDRIDGDLGYSPENCRWATAFEQNNNRACVKQFTYNGKTLSMKGWAKEIGMPYKEFYKQMKKVLP